MIYNSTYLDTICWHSHMTNIDLTQNRCIRYKRDILQLHFEGGIEDMSKAQLDITDRKIQCFSVNENGILQVTSLKSPKTHDPYVK